MDMARNDPFLGFTTAILKIVETMLIVFAVAGVALFVFAMVKPDAALIEISTRYPGADSAEVRTALMWTLAPIMLSLAVAVVFFNILGRIVRSTRDGSPFVAANADRLRKMAWLALAFTAIGMIVSLAGRELSEAIYRSPQTLDFDLGGLVLTIALLALSRVFRVGTRMQEDLEGTV